MSYEDENEHDFENCSSRLLNLYSCCVVVGDALHNPKVSLLKTDDRVLLIVSYEHLMNIEHLD